MLGITHLGSLDALYANAEEVSDQLRSQNKATTSI